VLYALLRAPAIDLKTQAAAQLAAEQLTTAIADPAFVLDTVHDDKNDAYILRVKKTVHGNTSFQYLDQDFIMSGDYAQLRRTADMLSGLIGEGATIRRGDHEKPVTEFRDALEWLLNEVRRNMTVQRYKGLGEMNPEQLWETTMDPTVRRLMKVQIEDAMAADDIFTTLMGDNVEPRRAFIEQNALIARNIDV
jgi:DNA gyrase subunit B